MSSSTTVYTLKVYIVCGSNSSTSAVNSAPLGIVANSTSSLSPTEKVTSYSSKLPVAGLHLMAMRVCVVSTTVIVPGLFGPKLMK